jgi:hypothetical protein
MACSVERSAKLHEINAMLAAGLGLQTIEKRLRADGLAIKRETIKRHLDRCLPATAIIVPGGEALPVTTADQVRQRRSESGAARDFASLVHNRALEALVDGELRVTTRDGLAAQAILDRREERTTDRAFLLNLARLLSGAGNPPPPEIVVTSADDHGARRGTE